MAYDVDKVLVGYREVGDVAGEAEVSEALLKVILPLMGETNGLLLCDEKAMEETVVIFKENCLMLGWSWTTDKVSTLIQ